jgi:predicted signal transduction protein with EAL and GGDEF domain
MCQIVPQRPRLGVGGDRDGGCRGTRKRRRLMPFGFGFGHGTSGIRRPLGRAELERTECRRRPGPSRPNGSPWPRHAGPTAVGGDEFVLLLTPTVDAEAARAFVVNVAERLKEPFFIDGHEIFASASIGVSMFPAQGASYDVLRRKADSAMYRVKGSVKGAVGTFEETMDRAATERMAAEQRLRLAIRDRRFCCAYQPKVEMRTGKVHGVEVLLRWQDDEGIIQGPGKFVELAVELGLINDIALQVLAETVRSFDEIEAIFGPDISISLNIAAKQACDLAFMTSFVDALAATGRAERFMIELTEEAFFTKSRFQADILPRIRAAGARVSIDDFGAGYSSLSRLRDLPVQLLKIDRSFLRDVPERPEATAMVSAILDLAGALGMETVAEGVENAAQRAFLIERGCPLAQGFLLGRPAPARDLEPLLRRAAASVQS